MQRIEILGDSAMADSVEYVDGAGEVHVRQMPHRAAEMMRRWARALRMLERIMAECMSEMGAQPARRAQGEAPPAMAGKARLMRDHPLDLMWKKRQISDRAYLAGRAIDTMQSQIAALQGLGSTLKSEGMLSGGGGQSDARVLALMQVSQRWAGIEAAILDDPECGSVEMHRRYTINVVTLVCRDGLSLSDIEAQGGYGRRAVLARRLKAGLEVTARALHIRGAQEGRISVAHFDGAEQAGDEGDDAPATAAA